MHTRAATSILCVLTVTLGCSTGSRSGTSAQAASPAQSSPAPTKPLAQPPTQPPPSGTNYDPPWANVQPTNTIALDFDAALSSSQNGAALAAAMKALQPGDQLVIGSGTWSIESYFDLQLQGTAAAPIWIVGKPGVKPIITRSNANQNVINVGAGGPTRYLAFKDLEFTGGSAVMRLHDCANVWVDSCHLHHGAAVCLTANSRDTDHLYITRNEMNDGGGTAEGMYLGANNAAVIMRDSIIALNHVHDCRGTQGDGIEVKQGSYGNWIVENTVHDTNYPAIIVYGTGGQAPNVIERNVCFNSGDNVMQVQGEAIVRNNLLMNGAGSGFHSHDHQGQTRDLVVVHNTIITPGRGMNLASWSGRAGMVLANNAVFTNANTALRFPNGSLGVTVAGNVVSGSVTGYTGGGVTVGSGLSDFVDVTFDATKRDARPSAGSAVVGAGDATHAVSEDITGATRTSALESGCYDAP